jgi:1-deoxy-D-xylulose-5-phosphate reductoisomerase
MSEIEFISEPTIDDYLETDKITRILAQQLVTNSKS